MIAVIRPEAHLPLGVVQRVQCVPAPKAMAEAMPPVIGEIQDQGVNEKGQQRVAEQWRDQRFQRRRDKSVIDQHA